MSLNFQDFIRPKRHDDGNHPGDFHDTPEAYYRQIYFEALDLIINCIEKGLISLATECFSLLSYYW